MHLSGVHLTGVHLTDVHLPALPLCVYLIGVHLTGLRILIFGSRSGFVTQQPKLPVGSCLTRNLPVADVSRPLV